MNLGKLFKRLRTSKGLTQKELAEKSRVSLGVVSAVERNRYKYPENQQELITRFLHVMNLTNSDLMSAEIPLDELPNYRVKRGK